MTNNNQMGKTQTPVNAYILRAVTNIIVPEGMDNIEVIVGSESVKVKTSIDKNESEIAHRIVHTADNIQ